MIAGYHWFSDWERDTMISLPSLLLIPHRFEEAKCILKNFTNHCQRGLVPNAFLNLGGDPIYNTVDGSLWYNALKIASDLDSLLGFDAHPKTAGFGTISEVLDGNYPHSPGGCIAQAWSVAEILRAYVEDIPGIKP